MSIDDTRAGEVAAEEVEAVIRALDFEHIEDTRSDFRETYCLCGAEFPDDDAFDHHRYAAALAAVLPAHDARVRAECDEATEHRLNTWRLALDVTVKERDEARSERDRLQAWKDEALPVMSGLQELGRALGLGLGKQITARASVDVALDLRAERDRLAAEAETQHRLRVEAEQHARDADRERDRVVAEVERFAESLEQADADCGSCSQRLAHAARLRKILTPVDTRTCGCAGIPQQVCDICQGVTLLAPADDGEVG